MSLPLDTIRAVRLPPETRLIYHAEGAANIIYKILLLGEYTDTLQDNEEILARSPEESQHSLSRSTRLGQNGNGGEILSTKRSCLNLHGKLLRLRKDRAHSTAALQAMHEFERHIAPLFGADDLIRSTAVKIEDDLLSRLNSELRLLEQQNKRPKSRCGMYLRQEAYGTMMDDMRHAQSSTSFIIELKPKWLLQSPDAPRSARRCRTCALRAYRASLQGPSDSSFPSTAFCPISLASQDKTRIAQTLQSKLAEERIPAKLEQHVISYLAQSGLIQRLKRLQGSLYPPGVLKADPADTKFLVAMTLRDCSLYLTVNTAGVTSARLGDLDVKSPTRMDHWVRTEKELIEGGWYEKKIPSPHQAPCALEGS